MIDPFNWIEDGETIRDKCIRAARESRERSIRRLDDAQVAKTDPYWDRVAINARLLLGPHWDEFVELADMARETDSTCSFLLDYTNPATRPEYLKRMRGLLSQHVAVMRRGQP